MADAALIRWVMISACAVAVAQSPDGMASVTPGNTEAE